MCVCVAQVQCVGLPLPSEIIGWEKPDYFSLAARIELKPCGYNDPAHYS